MDFGKSYLDFRFLTGFSILRQDFWADFGNSTIFPAKSHPKMLENKQKNVFWDSIAHQQSLANVSVRFRDKLDTICDAKMKVQILAFCAEAEGK